MKNKSIIRKITQGVYVLTTEGGGCVVDAVSQVSGGEYPLIAVSVNKNNYTNERLHQNRTFALSVLGIDVDFEIIKTFGLNSMRDMNKFEHIKTKKAFDLPIIEDSLGYMICEKVDTIENETHTLFIGKLVEADVYQSGEAMSYSYYQDHKDELMKVKTQQGHTAWVCTMCGYVYYGDILPDDFKCPLCGAGKDLFVRKDS